MKRFLSALLALLMLMSILASCQTTNDDYDEEEDEVPEEVLLSIKDEKKRAKKLSDYCDAKHEKYTSYKMDMTIKMVVEIASKTLQVDATMEEIRTGIGKKSFFYYSEENSVSKLDGVEVSSQSNIELYKDGKHYINCVDDSIDAKQRLCAEVSLDDFLEYIDSNESEFDQNDCSSVTCVQNEDKSWTAVYEGYAKEAIDIQLKEMSLSGDEFGTEIIDFRYTYNVDEDMNATSGKLEFIFEAPDGGKVPVLEAVIEISGIDSTKEKTVSLDGYTEVDSVIALKELQDKIKDVENDEDGSFTLTLKQRLTYGTTTQTKNEVDNVSYGLKDGKYIYDATAETDSAAYIIKYENGYQTVKLGTQSQKNAQSEAEARAFINGLINTSSYAPIRITDVTIEDDGSYTLESSNPNYSMMNNVFTQLSVNMLTYKSQTITVSFNDDGSINTLDSVLTIRGKSSNGASCEFYIKATLEIK